MHKLNITFLLYVANIKPQAHKHVQPIQHRRRQKARCRYCVSNVDKYCSRMNSHVNDLKTVSKLILICGCSHSSLHFFFFFYVFRVPLLNFRSFLFLNDQTQNGEEKKRNVVILAWLGSLRKMNA